MYIIVTDKMLYGPFKTADAATKWAKKNFTEFYHGWRIAPLKAP